MTGYFIRKTLDIKNLIAVTQKAKQERNCGSAYKVTKEVKLSDLEFKQFAEDLLEEQPWISRTDGGMNLAGEIMCIRVRNAKTGERILVNSEGYDYPRYTAIEE